MIKAIIIDDEVHCVDTLSILLADFCPEVEIMDKCMSAKKGLEAIERHKPELVFLDIEMPIMNGFELLEQFKEIPFSVIFTTSYDQYAIKAIRFSALDYLLKPIDPKELIAAVHKVQLQKAPPSSDQLRMLMDHIRGKEDEVAKLTAILSNNASLQIPSLSQSKQRRLAAILFTDIVGYTAIMQQSEVQALTIIRRYTIVLKQAVGEHGGEILNDYGDGSLCVFSSASEAMHCALEMQTQLQTEPAVPLRIGLHIGEILFENGKILGDGVNIASRIQSIGKGNSVLFSEEMHDKIKNIPDLKSVLLGRINFKNVDKPVTVFALANQGLVVPKSNALDGKLKPKSPFAWMQNIFLSKKEN
jgi:class 3 adenylate cyclase